MAPKSLAVRVIAAGSAIAAAAVASAATAWAEPDAPVDPAAVAAPAAPPPPPPGAGLLAGPVDPAAITAPPPPVDPSVAMLGPLGAVAGGGGPDFLLSQYPVPSVGGAAAVPDANVLQAGQFLIPQNYRVPTPDQVSPYDLTPGTPGPFARVDGLKGAHAMLHGALGRMPADQLSEPLPGTAPPPGTNIPAGPMQNLPDPAAPVEPPLLPPPPAG